MKKVPYIHLALTHNINGPSSPEQGQYIADQSDANPRSAYTGYLATVSIRHMCSYQRRCYVPQTMLSTGKICMLSSEHVKQAYSQENTTNSKQARPDC